MPSFVVDTSVVIKWIFSDGEHHLSEAFQVYDDLKQREIEVFVPELLKYEVGNVWVKGKKLSATQCAVLNKLFYSLPLTYVPENEGLAELANVLASNCQISYYDASFLAVAKSKGIKLITDDIKMYKQTAQYGSVRLVAYQSLNLY